MDKCVNYTDMTGGNRIVAFDAGSHEAVSDEILLTEEVETSEDVYEAWDEAPAEAPAPARWRSLVAPSLAGFAIIAWTAAFIWSKRAALFAPSSLDQWIGWIGNWSGPVLLVCVVWLLAMRSSKREAARFGDAARLLGEESRQLSARLTSVNSDLSMARDFIAAQARDLESLGRVAVERLSQNATELQGLIQTNSAQIESIGSVSTAALDNMEKLRGQLPVIANSARDVTNNIGNAGRTAHAQLQEMIAGFKRLNEFGQASERQVEALRQSVSDTLGELLEQTGQLEELATQRFAGIAEQGTAFRTELAEYEAQAIAALKAQSEALSSEFAKAHSGLEVQEETGFAALRERIDLLVAETTAISGQLASNEQEAIAGFSGRLALIDNEIETRQLHHQQRVEAIASHGETIGTQMEALTAQLAEVTAHAEGAEQRLASSVDQLSSRITEGRSALGGAEAEIAELTDASVRLLELIQAGSQHSKDFLPAALAEAEMQLSSVEARILAMRETAREVATLGETLHGVVGEAQSGIEASASSLAALHSRIGEQTGSHTEALDGIRQSLEAIEAQSGSLAAQLEGNLKTAIEKTLLDRSAEFAAPIEQASLRASELARETTIQLRDSLAKVDELAGNLERRVAHARERAEEKVENDFARRVALITESLNSNAIDIARAIDSEVSDVAWAAYLKGDRGIFTRRAVSLVEAGEAKAIVQVYQNDSQFHDHVNRYIHDFEAMLRQVLSTRDGNALGVTLLSSDMGKLYVALAQAIERLRR